MLVEVGSTPPVGSMPTQVSSLAAPLFQSSCRQVHVVALYEAPEVAATRSYTPAKCFHELENTFCAEVPACLFVVSCPKVTSPYTQYGVQDAPIPLVYVPSMLPFW